MTTTSRTGARLTAGAGLGLVWGFAAALLLLVLFALTYKISSEGEQERALIDRTNLNLVRTLEEHTLRTLKSVDQSVLFLKFQYEKIGAAVDIAEYVREGMIISSIFNQLGVIDERGIYLTSNLPDHKQIDLSDREHFKVHRERDTNQLFVSKPVLGRASGKWSIQMTRRINKPDGAFGGVVVISVDPFYFTSLYSEVRLGSQGVISLVGTDGVVRARRAGENVSVGQNVADSALLRLAGEKPEGTYESVSPIDKVRRFVAYRKLDELPLIVQVGVSEDEAMADYRQRVANYKVFGGLVALVVLAFAVVTTLMLLRQQRVAAELEASRAKAEESNRLKSEFLASMSHELRTPLNGVIGYAELLQESLSGEEREYAETIGASGRHLLELVNSVLDLAKVEAGKLVITTADEDFREIVRHVCLAHLPTAQAKGLDITMKIEDDVPAVVRCDRTRVVQVLNNLVHNAVKFTVKGHIHVAVSREAARLRVAVTDTGPGVVPEHREAIFEKFRQSDRFITREHGGAGLGLALARQLATAMGGELVLDSTVGEGSTFSFTVPIASSTVAPAAPAAIEEATA